MKNFFLFPIRSAFHFRKYYVIAIVSLSVGLTGFVLFTLLTLKDSFISKNYKDYKNVFQLKTDLPQMTDLHEKTSFISNGDINTHLAAYPEVQSCFRMADGISLSQVITDKSEIKNVIIAYADSSLPQFFPLDYTGNIQRTLSSKGEAVITSDLSLRLFGKVNSLGKELMVINGNGKNIYKIGCIVTKGIDESVLQFDMLLPIDNEQYYGGLVLLHLQQGTDPASFLHKLNQDKSIYSPMCRECKYYLFPVSHLYFDNSETQTSFAFLKKRNKITVYIALTTSLLVLLIGFINFLNILVTVSYKRTSALKIQIFNGACFSDLSMQTIIETSLILLLSFILSLMLMEWLIPYFNSVFLTTIQFPAFSFTKFLAIALLLFLFLLFISCSYVFYRIAALFNKNDAALNPNLHFNKSLILLQYIVSIGLLVVTAFIYKQIRYMDKGSGIMPNIAEVKYNGSDSLNLAILKDELEKNSWVIATNRSATNFLNAILNFDPTGQAILSYRFDPDFIKAFGFSLKEGHTFGAQSPAFDAVVNEEYVRKYGIDNPVGKYTTVGKDTIKIIGIVKNFYTESFTTNVKPTIILRLPSFAKTNYLQIKINPGNIKSEMKNIGQTIKALYPGKDISLDLINDEYLNYYKPYRNMLLQVTILSLISGILIIMGLFGYSLFSLELRQKEIGIRKVNGATRKNILSQINTEYFRLFLLSLLVSYPAAYCFLNHWLHNFVYKVRLDLAVFLLIGILFACISHLCVTWFTWQAASRNPTDILRS